MKPPCVQKTKVRNTSNTQSHDHTRPSTYSTTNLPTHPHTDLNNPPTHQPTHPRCATAIEQSTAEYSRTCGDDDTNRVAVTLGFACICNYLFTMSYINIVLNIIPSISAQNGYGKSSNRPVDPGSIQGSHRPIPFIRKKLRIRADYIWCKTEY